MLFLNAFQILYYIISKFHTETTKSNLIACQNLIFYLQLPFNYWGDKNLNKIKIMMSPESILSCLLHRTIPFHSEKFLLPRAPLSCLWPWIHKPWNFIWKRYFIWKKKYRKQKAIKPDNFSSKQRMQIKR